MRKIFLLLVFCTLFSLVGNGIFAATLKITTPNLDKGTLGVAYNKQLQAEGGIGKYTFSKSGGSLPPGINLYPDGWIRGTPTKEGADRSFDFEVRVVDENKPVAASDKKSFSIFINLPELKITNPSGGTNTLASGTVGEPYEFTFQAEGGVPPYTWTNPSNVLKQYLGLQLSSDGKITGVPIIGGNRTTNRIIVKGDTHITDQSTGNDFYINIAEPDFEIITTNLSPGNLGSPYIALISAHGGKPGNLQKGEPVYSWTMLDGSLPPGLTHTTNSFYQKIIKGTPTTEGEFSFRVLVEDNEGEEINKSFLIKIEKDCKCAGGTPCGSCNAGNYCDGTTKTLASNPICQGSGASGGNTPTNSTGGFQVSGEPDKKMEFNWPPSPRGTPLNEKSSLTDLVRYFYEWAIGLGGLAAFIALVIAGVQYLTSAGNATKMKEALDKIKSAALGLVLLLGTVLILNTINPQLTELKMPPIPPGGGGLDSIPAGENNLTSEECSGAIIYRGKSQNEPYPGSLTLGKNPPFPEPREINSVQFAGSCKLTLYPSNNCTGDPTSPNPPVTLAGNNKMDVGLNTTGDMMFKCAVLEDASFQK